MTALTQFLAKQEHKVVIPDCRRTIEDPFAQFCDGTLCGFTGLDEQVFAGVFAAAGFTLYTSWPTYAVFTGAGGRSLHEAEWPKEHPPICVVDHVSTNAFYVTIRDAPMTVAEVADGEERFFVAHIPEGASRERSHSRRLRSLFGEESVIYRAISSHPAWRLVLVPKEPIELEETWSWIKREPNK